MNNVFKKNFFSNLLVDWVIISNIIGVKYTTFNGLILSVNFITLPFVFLCFLLINHFSNKKEAWLSVLNAIIIQIFILLTYIVIVNIESQNIIPDLSRYVNILFQVDLLNILVSLIALVGSIFVLQYIYEYF